MKSATSQLSLSSLLLAALILTSCTTTNKSAFNQPHVLVPNSDFKYGFNKAPFINPKIIQDLSCWISDRGDQVVAINVLDSQDSNRYFGEVKTKVGLNPFIFTRSVEGDVTSFGYQFVGRTDSGIYVLRTSDRGGSGAFNSLILVTFNYDKSISCDWDRGIVKSGPKRLLIKKLGEFALGDRWDGELQVRENAILVGKDKGWFAGGDQDRIIKIDFTKPLNLKYTKAQP